MDEPILSIIIPVYNGEGTISRTIESILMQDCTYPYEIIVVDDASTDNTIGVVEGYYDKYNIRLFRNEHNLGNGGSFYNGLRNCHSKYWCVLDADDYYSNRKKIQRQINFLESDINEEYVGVAHNYLIEYGDGSVDLPQLSDITEFDYDDFLIGRIVYCHTSTYMYRNIFNGNPPEYLKEERFRGDTIRTAILLMETRKKIKILDMVASVYNMTGGGIWSSLDNKKRLERQIILFTALKSISKTKKEIAGYNYLMKRDRLMFRISHQPSIQSLQSLIDGINSRIGAYESKAITDRNAVYCSSYYDSIIESIGCMMMLNHLYEFGHGCIAYHSLTNSISVETVNDLMSEYDCDLVVSFDFGFNDVIGQKENGMMLSINDISKTFSGMKDRKPSRILCVSSNNDCRSALFSYGNADLKIKGNYGHIIPGMTLPHTETYIDGECINVDKAIDVGDCHIPGKMDSIRRKTKSFVTKFLSRFIDQ